MGIGGVSVNWEKIATGFAAMMLGVALTFGTVTEAAKSSPTIRYFMQQPGVQGSATPYGNNEKAGHYVQAGDAKIYKECFPCLMNVNLSLNLKR